MRVIQYNSSFVDVHIKPCGNQRTKLVKEHMPLIDAIKWCEKELDKAGYYYIITLQDGMPLLEVTL